VGSVTGANECDNLAPTKIRSPNRAACTESLYRLSYPGTWINSRRMKYELYSHVTVHRNRFIFNNQADALIIQILFCCKTLHVSGSLFAHHQEFCTVHSALVSFMQFLMTVSKQSQDGTSWLFLEMVIKNLHETYQCRMYSTVENSWWWAKSLPETCRGKSHPATGRGGPRGSG